MADTLAISMPGPWEWAAILIIGVLIFGRRLPEIARSLGKSVVEFKRGLADVKGEIDVAAKPPEPTRLPPGPQQVDSVRPEVTPPPPQTQPQPPPQG